MRSAISDWKRWTATKTNVQWQRDFFDHRIRPNEESPSEKMNYILTNHVRAGLVAETQNWPYFSIPTD